MTSCFGVKQMQICNSLVQCVMSSRFARRSQALSLLVDGQALACHATYPDGPGCCVDTRAVRAPRHSGNCKSRVKKSTMS